MTTRFSQTNKYLPALLVTALAVLAVAVVFGPGIRNELQLRLTERAVAPDRGACEEILGRAHDPEVILDRLWRTRKIPHRTLTLELLKDRLAKGPDLSPRMNELLIAAAADADLSSRELALGILSDRKGPNLRTLALAQLGNVDPLIRLLGVKHFSKEATPDAVPTLIRMLDDPDLTVVATSGVALRKHTGNDFGIRIADAMQQGRSEAESLPGAATERRKPIVDGVRRLKEWWREHAAEYPPDSASGRVAARPQSLIAQDVPLVDLAGQRLRFSNFHGKPVLLNFWTTWCLACQKEMPTLVELQRRNPELVLLGISLDGVSDEHGHTIGTHALAGEETDHTDAPKSDTTDIRAQVQRFAQKKGLNYRIILDSSGQLAAAFNGHELPTNILIDPNGRVRRRFVGERSLAVLEAMIGELAASSQVMLNSESAIRNSSNTP